MLRICYMLTDMMVIWYNICVWFHTTCSCSITCPKMGHRKNWTALPTIHTENTDQLRLGLCFFIRRWTLRTNVCGVRSGEAGCHWDVMLYLCMCRNHTHLCANIYIYILKTVQYMHRYLAMRILYTCTSHRA